MGRTPAIVCALVTGALVSLQPPANAALSRYVGDFGGALVSTVMTVSITVVLFLLLGDLTRLSGLAHFRPEYAIGGIGGATVVIIGLVAVRPLGAGAVVALLVAGQLIVSVISDRLGWFGGHVIGLSLGRIAGVALVVVGTTLISR